uniref:Calpain catalytic domain-containing protein n=1 Tax=Photinus pyralis TaxID=7054 RepID=A0A1Y1LE04_PHOPY
MNPSYQQYRNAYPELPFMGAPCASNGYGWHGNGYGWQLDPLKWTCPSGDTESNEVVSEPILSSQKVEGSHAWFGSGRSLGESGSGIRARGAVQDFYELRDYHVDNGTLFEDPEFPADSSSLTHNGRTDRHYEWLRPGEIVDDPQLFVEGYSRFDVQQGELGDCWLLAAVANLTLYRRLFFQIVPDDQGFDEKYAGIFHFRFWQYGRWIDVVIDDRLPTYRGQLVYLHSNEENEFWSALLEKAYAKLHGSYEALKGGSTCEAMEDFTGGVTEMYEMKSSPPNLFKIILKAYERGSLMGCSLEPDPHVLEAETPEGLIRGHAYSITRVKYVDIRTPNTVGKIPLLRLRNPWGNEIEWNGPWSDQSPEWRFIPDYEKTNLGLTVDHDGEFWMSLKDFQNRFDRVEICNLTPDSLTEEEISRGNMKQWEMSVFEGEWVRGVSSGGCRNFLETFPYNPQYRITLTEIDDDDEDNKCTVIIALLQKNRRSKKQRGVEFLSIGFAVFYLSDPSRVPKPLDLNYFKYNVSVARSPSFINLREVTCRFRLPPGTYCIVPSTYEPNEEGEFLLRVFSEKKNNMEYGYDQSHNDHDADSDHGSDQGHNSRRYNYNPPRGYTAMSNFNPGGYSSFFNSGGLSDFSGFARNFFQFQQPGPRPPAHNPQAQYTNPNYPRPQYYPPPNQQHYTNPNYPQPPSYVQPNQSRLPYPQQPQYPQQPPPGGYGFKF